MNLVKSIFASLSLLIGFSQMSQAQAPALKLNKNAIYANAGGVYQVGAGLHYDRVILGNRIIYLTAGTGIGQAAGMKNSPLSAGTYVPLNLGLSIGFAGHYLEAGGGLLSQISASTGREGFNNFTPGLSGGHLQVGYKFVAPKKVGLYVKVYGDGLFISDVQATSYNNLQEWYQGTINATLTPSLGLAVGITF
jgi:hypothetical protein